MAAHFTVAHCEWIDHSAATSVWAVLVVFPDQVECLTYTKYTKGIPWDLISVIFHCFMYSYTVKLRMYE